MTVANQAGVATHYPDDAADDGVRSSIIPTLGIFSQAGQHCRRMNHGFVFSPSD